MVPVSPPLVVRKVDVTVLACHFHAIPITLDIV
jgi:hypothetical protein